MADKVYADGLVGKLQETKFGNITKLSFKVDEFVKFLNENSNNGWVNVDLFEKKSGDGFYGVLNSYKPTGTAAPVKDDSGDLPF